QAPRRAALSHLRHLGPPRGAPRATGRQYPAPDTPPATRPPDPDRRPPPATVETTTKFRCDGPGPRRPARAPPLPLVMQFPGFPGWRPPEAVEERLRSEGYVRRRA